MASCTSCLASGSVGWSCKEVSLLRVVPSCRAASGQRLASSQYQLFKSDHRLVTRAVDESSAPILVSSQGTDHSFGFLSYLRQCCLRLRHRLHRGGVCLAMSPKGHEHQAAFCHSTSHTTTRLHLATLQRKQDRKWPVIAVSPFSNLP